MVTRRSDDDAISLANGFDHLGTILCPVRGAAIMRESGEIFAAEQLHLGTFCLGNSERRAQRHLGRTTGVDRSANGDNFGAHGATTFRKWFSSCNCSC